MKKLMWGSLLAATLLAPALAQAADGDVYGGVQWMRYDFEDDTEDLGNQTPKAFQLTFGGDLNDYAALEMRLGSSLQDSAIANTDSVLEIDQTFGFYTKIGKAFETPVGAVKPYGILGFSKFNIQIDSDDERETFTESDKSWGVGVAVTPIERVSFGVEFMRVADRDDYTLDSVAISASYRLNSGEFY